MSNAKSDARTAQIKGVVDEISADLELTKDEKIESLQALAEAFPVAIDSIRDIPYERAVVALDRLLENRLATKEHLLKNLRDLRDRIDNYITRVEERQEQP